MSRFRHVRPKEAGDTTLHLVKVHRSMGIETIEDEVPPIHDLGLDVAGGEHFLFEFGFDEEKQVPFIEASSGFRSGRGLTQTDRIYIANAESWEYEIPYSSKYTAKKNPWDWVPKAWHDDFDGVFAEPTGEPSNQTLWFGDYTGSTKLFIWTDEEVPLEEAASALDDMKLKGRFVSDEQMKELYQDAEKDVRKEHPDLDPENDEFREKVQEQAEADLTYTESGYIPSDEWGAENWSPAFAQALTAATYYISRLMHPTDEDVEYSQGPPEALKLI